MLKQIIYNNFTFMVFYMIYNISFVFKLNVSICTD